jgi:hypothetical protein
MRDGEQWEAQAFPRLIFGREKEEQERVANYPTCLGRASGRTEELNY